MSFGIISRGTIWEGKISDVLGVWVKKMHMLVIETIAQLQKNQLNVPGSQNTKNADLKAHDNANKANKANKASEADIEDDHNDHESNGRQAEEAKQ